MDSDVHIAEFFIFDSQETASNSKLKKVNLSHMQRSMDVGANKKTIKLMIECVRHFQLLVLNHGKLPRIYKAITPTLPTKEIAKEKIVAPEKTPRTPLLPVNLILE
jgi:hypothetical protein